ncbi:hypothetical protein INTERNEXUS_171 [Bacillus phage vB_BspM_Internexus]|nr:hypothetical protein INTERNEXUS_171 [Bacillus phage vB_BspM_Internexus]
MTNKIIVLFITINLLFLLSACGKPNEEEAHKQVESFITEYYGDDLLEFNKENVEVKELKENMFRVLGMFKVREPRKIATIMYSIDARYDPDKDEWYFENVETHDIDEYLK